MYVRVRFDNPDSEATKNTLYQLGSIPNGTCLTHAVFLRDIIEKFGNNVGVWYVDFRENTRNRINSLLPVTKLPGVNTIDILPFDDPVPDYGTPEWDKLRDAMLEYLEKH
jgi:hypothetical protein